VGTYRYDQICDELVRLQHEIECYDGSRSIGFVTPDMKKKADELRTKFNLLEDERVEIDLGMRPNPRI
jgi:hypothetical protein